MIFEQIETAINSRLSALVAAGVEVQVLPETKAEFKPVVKPRVTTAFRESRFEGELDNKKLFSLSSAVVQDEILFFDISVQARKLRGSSGVYAVLDAVRALLIGFRPGACEKMLCASLGFAEYSAEGFWTFAFTMSTKFRVVEKPDEEIESLIKSIKTELFIKEIKADETLSGEVAEIPSPPEP